MINISFYKNGFIVSGHSNLNNIGNDIICAGVSSIIMGSLNWFTDNLDYIYIDDGYVKLVVNQLNQDEIKYLNLIKIQLNAMNHGEYKKHISITVFDELINNKGEF